VGASRRAREERTRPVRAEGHRQVNVRKIRVVGISQPDLEAWRALARRATPPNPMSEPECVVPAAAHLRNGAAIVLVVAEEGGRWLACFPLQALRRWHVLPCRVLSSRIRRMTWDATPLVDPDHAEEAVTAVVSELSQDRRRSRAHFLVLEWLNDLGKIPLLVGSAASQLNLPVETYDTWERPLLVRRDEPTYDSIHSSKHRSDRRRMLQALSRELGGEPRVVDRGGDAAAVERFIELEAAGYKAQTGVAMRTQPGEVEWFRAMCADFAAQGRLHCLALEVGDTTVAMVLFLRSNEGIYLVKVTYDERFHRYSPGIQLHLATLGWFHDETDAEWLDVCTYKDNTTMLRQYPDRRTVSTLLVGLGRRTDRLFLGLLRHDASWQRVVYRLCGALGVRDSATNLLVEGGNYGSLRPVRTPRA